ncbi:phage shock protein PspA [Oleidesulfovibrio sp.]|uniref:phage shock protein PspA n=1 Tax=Oleidesulfovibrio sp. TaxID=2909707 RepID=UPI003A8C5457
MGIFSRFKDIVSANMSAMLDKAEDPEKLIRLMIREMEETLVELKANCAGSMAEAKRVGRELDIVEQNRNRWAQRAEMAVSRGREDLAREALHEKLREQEKVDALLRELAGIEGLVDQAREDITTLEEKLNAAREKQRLLMQRHAHARVRTQARRDMNRAVSLDAMRRFDELEQRVEFMEAEAEIETPVRKPDLEERFADLEGADEVERELEELRRKVNPAS